MKVWTADQDKAHFSAVVRSGCIGGAIGMAAGLAGAAFANRRYTAFQGLTLPFKTFLVTSVATSGAIINAEHTSTTYARDFDPASRYIADESRNLAEARRRAEESKSAGRRALDIIRDNRYKVVCASWLSSMAYALHRVSKDKYLTGPQKIVQARMYAQGLTLLVLVATAALEISDAKSGAGRYETVLVIDPADPEHKKLIEKKIHKEEYSGQDLWLDMVASEERRLNALKQKEGDSAAVSKQEKKIAHLQKQAGNVA